MLSKVHLLKMLIGLVQVGDADTIRLVISDPSICLPKERAKVFQAMRVVESLMLDFRFEDSMAFNQAIVGKSDAYVQRFKTSVQDPVNARNQQHRFELALGEILDSDAVFALLPERRHGVLQTQRALIGALGNPA